MSSSVNRMITYDEMPQGTPTMRAWTGCVASLDCGHASATVKYLIRATSHDIIQLKASVFPNYSVMTTLLFESSTVTNIIVKSY